MTRHNNHSGRLYGIARFVLFNISYIPLYVLIIAKQISSNVSYLHWGGFSQDSLTLFSSKFGLTTLFVAISLFSILGCRILFDNLKKNAPNGDNVIVNKISNRNSESIGYIATYIMPFMFEDFDSLSEVLTLLFLLFIIYRIYINSNLLLINPILNFKYSIFEIEYEQGDKQRDGLIIIENDNINEDEYLKIYPIGFKLYYATKNNSI